MCRYYMVKKENTERSKKDFKVSKKKELAVEKGLTLFKGISLFGGLSDETRHSVIAILFFVIGIFLAVAPWNLGGLVGSSIYDGFKYLLGVGYFALPTLLFLLGVSFFRESRPNIATTASIGAFLFLFSVLVLSLLLVVIKKRQIP